MAAVESQKVRVLCIDLASRRRAGARTSCSPWPEDELTTGVLFRIVLLVSAALFAVTAPLPLLAGEACEAPLVQIQISERTWCLAPGTEVSIRNRMGYVLEGSLVAEEDGRIILCSLDGRTRRVAIHLVTDLVDLGRGASDPGARCRAGEPAEQSVQAQDHSSEVAPEAPASSDARDQAEIKEPTGKPWTGKPFASPRWTDLHRRLHGFELEFETEYFRWEHVDNVTSHLEDPETYESAIFCVRFAISGRSGFGGWFQAPFSTSNHPTSVVYSEERSQETGRMTFVPRGNAGSDAGLPSGGGHYTWELLGSTVGNELSLWLTIGLATYLVGGGSESTETPTGDIEWSKVGAVGATRFEFGQAFGGLAIEPHASLAADVWRFTGQLDFSVPYFVGDIPMIRPGAGIGYRQPLGWRDSQIVIQAEGGLSVVVNQVVWAAAGALLELQLPVFRVGAGTRLVYCLDGSLIPTLVVRFAVSAGP